MSCGCHGHARVDVSASGRGKHGGCLGDALHTRRLDPLARCRLAAAMPPNRRKSQPVSAPALTAVRRHRANAFRTVPPLWNGRKLADRIASRFRAGVPAYEPAGMRLGGFMQIDDAWITQFARIRPASRQRTWRLSSGMPTSRLVARAVGSERFGPRGPARRGRSRRPFRSAFLGDFRWFRQEFLAEGRGAPENPRGTGEVLQETVAKIRV